MRSIGEMDLRGAPLLHSGEGIFLVRAEGCFVDIQRGRCEGTLCWSIGLECSPRHELSAAVLVAHKRHAISIGGEHWLARIVQDGPRGFSHIHNLGTWTQPSLHPSVPGADGEG